MRKYTKNGKTIKFLYNKILFLLLVLNIPAFAQSTVSYYSARLYIAYNVEPDELYIDGVKVDINKKNIYGVDTGEHTIEANRSCYYPIKITIKVKKGYTQPVRLKFKHLITEEYKKYKKNLWMNYSFSTITTIPAFFYESGSTTLLPISLLGFTGQALWQIKQKSKFDACDRTYKGGQLDISSFGIYFGINSRVTPEITAEFEEKYQEIVGESYYTVDILQWFKKRVIVSPNDTPLSSYSIMLGLQKRFGQNFYLNLYSNIYPKFTVRSEYYVKTNFYLPYKEAPEIIDLNYTFFIFGLDAEYSFYKSKNNYWNLLLGGFSGNTISEKAVFDINYILLDYYGMSSL